MQIVAETSGSLRVLGLLRGGRPNRLHRALARALSDRCPVVTTNFDKLIERAFGDRPKLVVLRTSDDFRAWGRRSPNGVLAKLHGSLDDTASLCATMRQVGALGLAFMWDPPRGVFLDRVRTRFPMAVLGYSGSDDADILPRLRITSSLKPLLWVIHGVKPLHVATELERARLAPGLSELLEELRATVVIGPTRDAIALLEGRVPASLVVGRSVRPRYSARIMRGYLGRRSAADLSDYIVARLFYESGYRTASRRLFAEVRKVAGERHPGLCVRCMTSEATVATDLGDWAGAGRLLDRAMPGLKRWADHHSFANACINRALVCRHMNETEQAEGLLENIIRATANNPAFLAEWASANANLADIAFEAERLDKAVKLLKRARRGLKAVGDHGGLARVCGTLGKVLYARGECKVAVVAVQMALWHARVAWDVTGEARLLNNLGTMQRTLGRPDAAEASYRRASELGRRVGDPEPEVVAAMGMVAVDLVRGQIRRAGRRARSCLKVADELGLDRLAMQTRGNLALALIASGEYGEALRLLRAISPFFEAHGPSEQAAFTLRNIGVCLGALGRTDRAVAILREAAWRYERCGRIEETREALELASRVT